MSTVPPIRREVMVEGDLEVAFAVFTRGIGRWWPLGELGVFHDGTVAFADGRIVETSARGEEAVWGTVTDWEPPSRIAFTWHPGAPETRASQVEVRFAPAGTGTLVTLVHRGWEVFADPRAAREEYDQGWPGVLSGFGRTVAETAAGAATEAGQDTWVALLHTPAVEPGEGVFGDERFPQHVAFLQRMQIAGYLVAAGTFGDASGAGMTILRLPAPHGVEEARRLAESDESVVGGLFEVRVRPWDVRLTG